MEMLYLNDDCLCLIFRYLTLKEQLILTKVCMRFCDLIVENLWSTEYQHIQTNHSHNGEVSEKALHAYGKMTALNKNDYQEFYALNIPNVQKLHIGDITREAFCTYLGRHLQRPEFVFYFSFKYFKLIDLTCVDKNLHDGHIRMITENCPELEVLHVCSPYVTGKHIQNLRKLRHLSVENCNLKAIHVFEITNELKTLTFLDIRGNKNLCDNVITTWGSSLRELYIDENELLKNSNLMRLDLSNIWRLSVASDLRIAQHGVENCLLGWKNFLDLYATGVEILKTPLYEGWDTVTMHFLKETYYRTSSPIFPNVKELHIRDCIHEIDLKTIFNFEELRCLYVTYSINLNEVLKFIQISPKLSSIHIDKVDNIETICKFVENARKFLDTLPDHTNINLHLYHKGSKNPKLLQNDLERCLEPDVFTHRSRLRIVTAKPDCRDDDWGEKLSWCFQFNENFIKEMNAEKEQLQI